MSANLPNLVSLFLCDEVIHDQTSGKTHVLGMFDAIRPHSFPHQQPRVGVFVALTGQLGTVAAWVQCLGPDGSIAFRTLSRNLKLTKRRPVLRVFFRILQQADQIQKTASSKTHDRQTASPKEQQRPMTIYKGTKDRQARLACDSHQLRRHDSEATKVRE